MYFGMLLSLGAVLGSSPVGVVSIGCSYSKTKSNKCTCIHVRSNHSTIKHSMCQALYDKLSIDSEH